MFELGLALRRNLTFSPRLLLAESRRGTATSAAMIAYGAVETAFGWAGNAGASQPRVQQYPLPQQVENSWLPVLAAPRIQHICEIGFNGGHSAASFLNFNPGVRVTSFDLVDDPSVELASRYLYRMFPIRFVLIKGDPRQTVPQYARDHPTNRCGAWLINGGDSNEALADIQNARLSPSAMQHSS